MAETVCPPCIRGRHHQLDYLTRPKKSSWATNYDNNDDHDRDDDDDDDSDGLEGFLWQYCSTNSRIHSARHNIHSVIVIANPI